MNKLFSVLLLLLSTSVLASEITNKAIIESVGDIHSITLDKNQSLTVYLPEGYADNNLKYPVMYVMDSQRYFLHSIAYQKTLTWQDKSPAFIVVGINTEGLNRKELFSNNSDEFIGTIQNKIVAHIEKHYRVNNMRMYFGWEKAGGFALELFAKQPKLFDAYFLASSTHFSKERLNSVNNILESNESTAKFFYYSLGSVESWALKSHKTLSSIFKKNYKSDLKWEFNLSKNDDHYSTPLNTFNKGLALYFSDYSPIRFYSIKEFKDFGGMTALKKHYKNRGDHYQISQDIHDDTKHYLLNQSINEGDFEFFKMLVNEFDGFIEEFDYSTGFIKKIGQFYLDNKAIAEAVSLYQSELIKNPKSDELLDALSQISQEHQQ